MKFYEFITHACVQGQLVAFLGVKIIIATLSAAVIYGEVRLHFQTKLEL